MRVPHDLHTLLARELATPGRYHLHRPQHPLGSPWWYPAVVWLRDRVHALWHALFAHVHVTRSGSVAIGEVLAALAVLLVLVALVRLFRNVRVARTRAAAAAYDRAPDADALLRRALDAAAHGDRRKAAQWLYAAAVAQLGLEGTSGRASSATVGDVRGRLRSRGGTTLAHFDAIARVFVAATYAERPVSSGEWESARHAFTQFGAEMAR